MEENDLKDFRCPLCDKLLFRYTGGEIKNCNIRIEQKCSRCKNTIEIGEKNAKPILR